MGSSLHPEVGEMGKVTHSKPQGETQEGPESRPVCPFLPALAGPGFLQALGGRLPFSPTHAGHLVPGVGIRPKPQDTHHQLEDWSQAWGLGLMER